MDEKIALELEQSNRLEELNKLKKIIIYRDDHIVKYTSGETATIEEEHKRVARICKILQNAKNIALKTSEIIDTNDFKIIK